MVYVCVSHIQTMIACARVCVYISALGRGQKRITFIQTMERIRLRLHVRVLSASVWGSEGQCYKWGDVQITCDHRYARLMQPTITQRINV